MWTDIEPLYESSGALKSPPPVTPTLVDDWEDLIDEMRSHIEGFVDLFNGIADLWALATLLGWTLSDWTRGTGSPKRTAAMNGGSGDDAFYVSHISDVRTFVEQFVTTFNMDTITWTMDPIQYKYSSGGLLQGTWDECNDMVFFNEARAGIEEVYKLPFNFRET